jgi:glutamate dehydrogenase
LLGLRRRLESAALGLLGEDGLGAALEAFGPGVAALVAGAAPGAEAAALIQAGIPEAAAVLATAPTLAAAPAIVKLAGEAGVSPAEAAAAWAAVGETFALDALRAAAERARASGAFGARAKSEALADLARIQARLARARLGGMAPEGGEAARLALEAAAAGDLVAIGVAARALAAA